MLYDISKFLSLNETKYPYGVSSPKFTRVQYDRELTPEYVSFYQLNKPKIGFKPHNIVSIDAITFVVEDITKFKKIFANVFTNFVISSTYSDTLKKDVHQVWVLTKIGSAEVSTIKYVVNTLYSTYPDVFYARYPSVYSFVDTPNRCGCKIIERQNTDSYQNWMDIINNLRLLGINVPYSVQEDIASKHLSFLKHNISLGQFSVPAIVAIDFVDMLIYLHIQTNMPPKEIDKILTTKQIDNIKWNYLNSVTPVTGLALVYDKLPYPPRSQSILSKNILTGKTHKYDTTTNQWFDDQISFLLRYNNVLSYPKLNGVWRTIRFLEDMCHYTLPNIFISKTKQVTNWINSNRGVNNPLPVIEYIKRKYYEC